MATLSQLEELERTGQALLDKVRCPKCHDVYEDPRVFQCVCVAWCLRCFKRHASIRPGADANYAFLSCPACHATTTWTHSINPSRPKSMIFHPASAPLPPTDEPTAAFAELSSEAHAAAAVDNVSELFRDLDICRLIQDYKDLCVRLCTLAWTHQVQLADRRDAQQQHQQQRHDDQEHKDQQQRHQPPPPRPQSMAPSRPPLQQQQYVDEDDDDHGHSNDDSQYSSSQQDHLYYSNGEHHHGESSYGHHGQYGNDYDERPPTPDLLSELDSILEDLDATSDLIAAREAHDDDRNQPIDESHSQLAPPAPLPRPADDRAHPPAPLPRPRPPPPLSLGTGKALSTTGGRKIGSFLDMAETPERD